MQIDKMERPVKCSCQPENCLLWSGYKLPGSAEGSATERLSIHTNRTNGEYFFRPQKKQFSIRKMRLIKDT